MIKISFKVKKIYLGKSSGTANSLEAARANSVDMYGYFRETWLGVTRVSIKPLFVLPF